MSERFDVVIQEIGDRKIRVIVTIQKLTGFYLGDIKKMLDGNPPYENIFENVDEDEALEIIDKLEDVGATVSIISRRTVLEK